MEKDLLAFCGLFCGDCAGYSGDIAASATDLDRTLKRYQFHRTARALFSEQIGDYDAFQQTLSFMIELKCPKACRERSAAETDCRIRACAIERGFWACFECDEFETCGKLKPLEELHGDACVRNMRGIKEMGLETWLADAERFWFGSDAED